MQKINEINQLLSYSLGFCISLCTIKSLRLLRFTRGLAHLRSTFERCFGELAAFSLFFLLIWFAFVQMMHLLHGSHLMAYSTLPKSMMSAFEIMLGKFDATQFIKTSPVMGSLVFIVYNVVIVYCILNIFISILTNAYAKVREADEKTKQFDLIDHLLERFTSRRVNNIAVNVKEASTNEYKSYFNTWDSVIDKLTLAISRVNKISILNIFY
jgi:hypothetical protein